MNIKTLDFFDNDLIEFEVEAESWMDLLSKLSQKLIEKRYVKISFRESIIEREKDFPTGLDTMGVKIAIPHTDSTHVLKPGIFIANLKDPILFKEMGNGIRDIEAELVFLLVVDRPKDQVKILKELINIFTQEKVLKKLKNSKACEEVMEILKGALG
ncbi:MAG: PTS sugar transporter subunit IIA [Thermotaleaceae bacterium]